MSSARLYHLPAPVGPFGAATGALLARLRDGLADLGPAGPVGPAPMRVDLYAVYTPSAFFARDASQPWYFHVVTSSGHRIAARFSSTVVDGVQRCSLPIRSPELASAVA